MLNYASNVVKCNMSALTYIINTYDKAQDLQQINIKDVKQLVNHDNKLISEIFHAFNHGKLGQYIGDIIVKLYKKDNPNNQSIWNTDTSRLTYLIKKIIYKNKSKWIVDKNGVETIKYLITPIMDHVKKMAFDYHNEICFNTITDTEKKLKISEIYYGLIIDIDNKKVHRNILKHIAPHFYVNMKRLKN